MGDTGLVRIYLADSIDKKLLGLYKRRRSAYRVVDHEGIIRLQIRDGDLVKTERQAFRGRLTNFLENHTEYGDAGRSIPEMFLVYRSRITDLSGLQNPEQVLSLAETELKDVAPDESVFCLANFR